MVVELYSDSIGILSMIPLSLMMREKGSWWIVIGVEYVEYYLLLITSYRYHYVTTTIIR